MPSMPMEPTKLPQRLVNSFKWAQVCVEWADEQNLLAWVGTMKELPYSTWFSGHGCAELGLAMLAGALRKVGKGGGDSFLPSYEFEISAKARGATVDRIPEHCCQYVDILRMLNESSRKSLQELEATCPKVSEDVWTFLLKQEFVYEQLCPRHRNRWGSYNMTVHMFFKKKKLIEVDTKAKRVHKSYPKIHLFTTKTEYTLPYCSNRRNRFWSSNMDTKPSLRGVLCLERFWTYLAQCARVSARLEKKTKEGSYAKNPNTTSSCWRGPLPTVGLRPQYSYTRMFEDSLPAT